MAELFVKAQQFVAASHINRVPTPPMLAEDPLIFTTRIFDLKGPCHVIH